ncbi:MAG TPA: TylF/MycF/NovP-related O-methyltransferase [Solirubrobacterales bacterium]|nr:TylF/MycF/NovP-related O-methyltransferase [Solirubrobacterales bacterium]
MKQLKRIRKKAYKVPWYVSFVLDREIGAEYGIGIRQKVRLLRSFHRNAGQVETLSSIGEHLELAAAIMRVPKAVSGDIIECGCYRGGSTCNLSLVCRLVGRRLIVADSFAGLPPITPGEGFHPIPHQKRAEEYVEGQFAASLETVKENLARHGDLEVCDFKVGYFHESLSSLDRPIAAAFLDVDLIESLKPCLEAIWPRLHAGGRLYVHEANDLKLVGTFFDAAWWREQLASEPPGFVGAGSGLPLAPLEGSELGYAEKPGTESRVEATEARV